MIQNKMSPNSGTFLNEDNEVKQLEDYYGYIESSHQKIHEGKFYTAAFSGTVAAGQSLYISYKTPLASETNKYVHSANPDIIVTGASVYYEKMINFTYDGTGGTNAIILQHNANINNPSKMQFMKYNVTPSVVGTPFHPILIPAGNKQSESLIGRHEYVIIPNCLCLARLRNFDNATATFSLSLSWYESDKYD